MKEISKSQFKPKALEIMRQVEQTGQPVIITDRGRPTLELRPFTADVVKQDPLDYLKGSVVTYIDPTKPVSDDDWESM